MTIPVGFNTSAVTAFPYMMPALTQITPFSYRDGMTYAKMIEGLRCYINQFIVPEFNGKMEEIILEFQAGIENAENTIIESKAAWQILFDAFMANVVAELAALNDAAVSDLVEDEGSLLNDALSKFNYSRGTYHNVKHYGVKGDGVTDDTAKLNAAAAAIFAIHKDAVMYIPAGNYKITGTIHVKCALEAQEATFNYTGTGTALIIGDVNAPGFVTGRCTFMLPRLIRVGANNYDGTSKGVRLLNLNSCNITSQFIQHFEEGIVFEGYSQGFVHNIIYPGTLWGNRRNIVLRKGTDGWCNDNVIIGGRLSGPTWGFPDDPLSNFILFEDQGALGSPNSNKFIGTSLEGANTHLYRVDLAGNYNVFDYCRWEHGLDQDVRIRYRTSANYCVLNGGYMQDGVQEVFDGPTIANRRIIQNASIFTVTNKVQGQSLESGIDTTINSWLPPNTPTAVYDSVTGRVTPRPGRYLVTAKVPFASSVAAGDRIVKILKGTDVQTVVSEAGKIGPHTVMASAVVTLNGFEYVEVKAFHTALQPVSLVTSNGYAQFSIELIQ